ncbi:MAG: DctP family TRAP transporter solute-binding subunit [Defluviitaleaceae bacterium]|nr:DctP family TRAP transporter solute-binding subunit [Defluviitaleaceae bacterium]
MKRLFAATLAFTMAVSLAACAPGGGGAPAPAPAPAPAAPAPAPATPPDGADDDGWFATSTDQFNLRFSITVADTTAWGIAGQLFADLINERTNGNVNIDIHFNEALAGGNQAQAAEMVMTGLVDLDWRSNIIFTVLNENYGVITLPFMYESAEQAREMLMGPAGEYYRQMLYNDNLVLLGFGESGMRQLTANVPIHTVDDLVGLRIRVPGMQLLMAAFERLGSNPISMMFAEVFMALQQGTIDGQENPVDVIYGNLIYEVQDYIILWNYAYDALFLTVNRDLFYSMPEDYQRIFREVGAYASEFQVNLNRERVSQQLAYFEEQGMTVITPTAEAMEGFRLVGEYMRDMFSAPDRFGPEVVELFTP